MQQDASTVSIFIDGKVTNTVQMDGDQGNYYLPNYSIGALSSGAGGEFFTFNGNEIQHKLQMHLSRVIFIVMLQVILLL